MALSAKAHQLRKGRYSEIGRFYIVTVTTHQRRPFFADWRLGRLVVQELRRAEQQGLAESLAWVVMPDHLHWLFQLKKTSLSLLLKQVKARSAIALNKVSGSEGQIWHQGFYDHALRREENLRKHARYIVANPVRAGLVKRVGDYPLWDAVWL
ncbi:transposase [Pseudomonas phytophila]|uniref:Transposase n=1 Tax=Pseudomonas phytophila TaxID=2867264 RepID=A0ABY6FDM0_9PSED|nr:transposase [Pseudomonas phytophila]UXZ95733.1 transposase [Pseudomonas phytophila]